MKTIWLFLVTALLSCEDKDYCFACKTTETTFNIDQNGVSHPSSTSSSVRYCGITQEEADNKEQAGTNSTYTGGNKATEKITECKKTGYN